MLGVYVGIPVVSESRYDKMTLEISREPSIKHQGTRSTALDLYIYIETPSRLCMGEGCIHPYSQYCIVHIWIVRDLLIAVKPRFMSIV